MSTIGVKMGRIQFQGGVKEELDASNLILLDREPAFETDKHGSTKMKVGDGKTIYKDLPYIDIGTIVDVGEGLIKSGSTIAVDSTIARKIDIPKIEVLDSLDAYDKSLKTAGTFYFVKES